MSKPELENIMIDEPEALSASELGVIQGRSSTGQATQEDVVALLEHIARLEDLLDECDGMDACGTEGWRHRLGID
jgi:hypothetical protein